MKQRAGTASGGGELITAFHCRWLALLLLSGGRKLMPAERQLSEALMTANGARYYRRIRASIGNELRWCLQVTVRQRRPPQLS